MYFSIGDESNADRTLGYQGNARFLVPDFTFVHWREAGLCPDFDTMAAKLRTLSQSPPSLKKCGWVGAVNNHMRVLFLNASVGSPHLLDAIWPQINEGTGPGRHSLEEQVTLYSCLLDARGGPNGYSGRVPLLLHSGRPLLYAGRSKEHFFDRTFYTYQLPEQLKPWVHFIPIDWEGMNLVRRLHWVLSPANAEAVRNITLNAQRFAAKHLTLEAVVGYLADTLLKAAKELAEKHGADAEFRQCK